MRRRDCEKAFVFLAVRRESGFDRVKRLRQGRKQSQSQRRQPSPAALAQEKRRAQPLLKRFHLIGHRRLGESQLGGSSREAFISSRGFEGPYRGQRRKASHELT